MARALDDQFSFEETYSRLKLHYVVLTSCMCP